MATCVILLWNSVIFHMLTVYTKEEFEKVLRNQEGHILIKGEYAKFLGNDFRRKNMK